MRYKVLDTFATPLHRFVPDMELEDFEIDGDVSVKRWVELGKLAELKVKPAKPDLASDQATMRAAFDAASELSEGGPIMIGDHVLYGTLKSAPDDPTVDVLVFSEDFVRRYPKSALDVQARSVSGDFTEERATKAAQAAVVSAARQRAVDMPEIAAEVAAPSPMQSI